MGREAVNSAGVLILLGVLGQPAIAASQPQEHPPRVEVGADAGVFTAIGPGGLLALVAAGPRVSLNVTDRLGVDLIAELVDPNESSALYGLYAVQLRHVIRDRRPTRSVIFLTGGVLGGFEYEHVPERRMERPDGSVVIYRAYTEGEVSTPGALVGGIGMQRALARFAAFRADAQALLGFHGGFVMRGTLGVSIPIGGAYVRNR